MLGGVGMSGSRGEMTRKDRQMPDADARIFLRAHAVASVGTSDAAGWPYLVPLMYVYETGDRLFFHTGARRGHFGLNIPPNFKICGPRDRPRPLQQAAPSPFHTALCLNDGA